jgi:hypothetical protein
VVFRLVGLVINDLRSWSACAGTAAASIAVGEFSEHRIDAARAQQRPLRSTEGP